MVLSRGGGGKLLFLVLSVLGFSRVLSRGGGGGGGGGSRGEGSLSHPLCSRVFCGFI